jgi:hypothetical protein
MQGDEIRALRRLQREQEASPHVFASERGGERRRRRRFGSTRSSIFHGRSTGGAQERGLECLIEVTSNLGHTLVAELAEEG